MVLQKDRTDVDVVPVIRWSVDNHCTDDAHCILLAVMRMVPGCSVKVGKEAVGERLARGNRTLLNCRNAIHIRLSLEEIEMGNVLCFVGEDHANGGLSLL